MNNEELQEVQPEINEQAEIVLEEEQITQPAQETDWKSEALKYKAIAQRYAKKNQGGYPEPKQELQAKKEDVDLRKTVEQLALAEKKRQFGYQHGLSPEEVDSVFKLNSEPTEETLKDPFVEGGLAKLRAKKRVEDNTPSSSSRSASFKISSDDKSPEAKQKALDEFVAKRFGR